METVDISEVRVGDVLASGDLVTGVGDGLMSGVRIETNGINLRRIARGTMVELAYRPRSRRAA